MDLGTVSKMYETRRTQDLRWLGHSRLTVGFSSTIISNIRCGHSSQCDVVPPLVDETILDHVRIWARLWETCWLEFKLEDRPKISMLATPRNSDAHAGSMCCPRSMCCKTVEERFKLLGKAWWELKHILVKWYEWAVGVLEPLWS